MNLTFYNHFNNGDLHISRNFVKHIAKYLKEYSPIYAHRREKSLLKDLNFEYEKDMLDITDIHTSYFSKDKNLFLNTWYASDNGSHMSKYGISFDCLYSIFDKFLIDNFSFSLKEINNNIIDYFPNIDYKYYNISNIETWLSQNKNKKILIINAHARSGQSDNFVMTPIINNLVEQHKDCTFIYTNIEHDQYSIEYIPKSSENLFYSNDIIKNDGHCDLNEIAFLSTHCDVIIGRATGPFTFAFNQDNLFNRKIKMICLTNLIPKLNNKFWLSDEFQNEIEYSSKIICSNETDINKIQSLIEKEI